MFALIDTKGATHIAIHIPHQGADRSIPALVGMLESNSVFVAKGWNSLEMRTPEMTIQLGDTLSLHNSDIELAITIPHSAHCLDDSFVAEAPEVWASFKKGIERRETELTRLRTELAHVKQQLEDLQNTYTSEDSEAVR